MKELLQSFIKEEDGMGVIEVVIIIAVLIGVALLFQEQIMDFVTNLMTNVFKKDQVNPW